MEKIKSLFGDFKEGIDGPLMACSCLLLCWLFTLMYGSENAPDTASGLLPVWVIFFLVAGLVSVLVGDRISRRADRPLPLALSHTALVAMAMASLAIVLQPEGILAIVCLIALGLLLPIAMAQLAERYAVLSLRRRVTTTVASALIGFVAVAIMQLLPITVADIIEPLIPLAIVALTAWSTRKPEAAPEEVPDEVVRPPVDAPRHYTAPFLATVALYGVMAALVGWSPLAAFGPSSHWIVAAAASVLLVAMTITTLHMAQHGGILDPDAAYKPAPLCAAVGFALLAFAKSPLTTGICCAAVFSGFGIFFVYCWIVIGNHIHAYGWRPLTAVCSALAALYAGLLAGCGLSWVLSNLPFEPTSSISTIGLLFVILVMWFTTSGRTFAGEKAAASEKPDAYVIKQSAAPHTDDESQTLDLLAQRYGLSHRELEVVALLIKGRNVPFICDELFIAKSTVQTHIKHIYSKMGVSGKQELLDIVEALED